MYAGALLDGQATALPSPARFAYPCGSHIPECTRRIRWRAEDWCPSAGATHVSPLTVPLASIGAAIRGSKAHQDGRCGQALACLECTLRRERDQQALHPSGRNDHNPLQGRHPKSKPMVRQPRARYCLGRFCLNLPDLKSSTFFAIP